MPKNSKLIDDQIAEFKERFGPPPVSTVESEDAYLATEGYSADMAGSLKDIAPFKAALIAYAERPGLTTADRAYLRRWAEDDRAEEVWKAIERAAQENDKPLLLLSPRYFICQILAIRSVAKRMNHLRKDRVRIRKCAEQIERIAEFLLMLDPLLGMRPIAQRLREAAAVLPRHVESTRESDVPALFMSQVSHYLEESTGWWLDYQVAVLTEIAFKDIGDMDVEQVQRARRVRSRPAAVKPPA
jgi:hypothetical protein